MMTNRERLACFAAAVCAAVGLVTAVGTVGREARLVDVLGVFFGAFGSGASLAVAMRPWRDRRRAVAARKHGTGA